MSGHFPIGSSQTNMIWNQDAILEKGIDFLYQKKEGLKVFQDLREAAQKIDYYCNSSIVATEKVKEVAKQSIKEMETLKKVATEFLIVESAKDPSSEQTKRLSKIILITDLGLEYFTTVIKNTDTPNLVDQKLRDIWLASNKALPLATLLVGPVFLLKESHVLSYQYNNHVNYVYLLWQIPAVACVASNVIRYLHRNYVSNPREQLINSVKNLFEKALSPT